MLRKIVLSTLSAIALATSAQAAGEFGTSAEAKAMLDKAVIAVKANKTDALAKFAKGDDGFKDRDLYPFCGGPDGNFTAHPSLTGKSMKDLKDKAGIAVLSQQRRHHLRQPGLKFGLGRVLRVDDEHAAGGHYL